MKKFAIFLMALSASMFTLGCQPSTPAKKPEEKKPAAGAEKAPEGEKTPAETPAAPK